MSILKTVVPSSVRAQPHQHPSRQPGGDPEGIRHRRAHSHPQSGIAGLRRVLALEGAAYSVATNAIAPIAATRVTAGPSGDLAERISPDSVSPVGAFVAHEDCPVSGRCIRWRVVFVGETAGVVLNESTAESVRNQLTDIHGQSSCDEPTSLDGATAIIARVST